MARLTLESASDPLWTPFEPPLAPLWPPSGPPAEEARGGERHEQRGPQGATERARPRHGAAG
eukprot:2467827-Pyramimonas_sp.AAC.1